MVYLYSIGVIFGAFVFREWPAHFAHTGMHHQDVLAGTECPVRG